MDKIFIEDLQEDQKITNQAFLVQTFKESTTRAGKEYYDLVFTDKTGEIKGKAWSNNMSKCAKVDEGTVVEITAVVSSYKDQLQFTVESLKPIVKFNSADFMAVSEHDSNSQYTKFLTYIESIKDDHIQQLLTSIFKTDKDFVEKFKRAFAGEKAHHNYLGGLLEHILEMIDFSEGVTPHYPQVNRDTVVAGIIFHDIGKVFELGVDVSVFRTREGHLMGHIAQGLIFVDRKISEIKDFPIKLREQLHHIILSHHGRLEYGSPVMPMTMEALLVHYVDGISSKLNIAKKLIDSASENKEFTDFSYLLESRFYTGANILDSSVDVDGIKQVGLKAENKDNEGDSSKGSLDRNLKIPF